MKPFITLLLILNVVLFSTIILPAQNHSSQNFQPTLLWEHGSSTEQPIYLSDSLILTAGYYSASLIDLTTKKLIRNYIPPFSPIVYNIHLSKDKTMLLMCTSQFIRIFDIATGNLLKSLENPAKNRYFTHAEFSPDASEFVVSRNEGSIFVYDANTLELKHSAKQHSNRCNHVTYSNNGQFIASAGSVHSIPLYDAKNLDLLGTFPNGNGAIQCLAFSSDDSKIAAVGMSKRLWVYDVNTKQELHAIPISTTGGRSVGFGNNDEMVTVSGRNGDLYLYDFIKQEGKTFKFNNTSSVTNRLHPNKGRIIEVNPYGLSIEFDLNDVNTSSISIPTCGGNVPERTIRFSDNDSLIVIGSDYVTKVLEHKSGDFVRIHNNHVYSINNFAISSDASKHLSVSAFNRAMYGNDSNYILSTEGAPAPIYSVEISKNGEIGLIGDSIGYLSKWNLTTLEKKYRIRNESSNLDIKLSPNNKYFAVAIGDSVTKIFDTETGNLIFSYQSPNDPWLLQWSSDNETIYMTDVAGKFYSISMSSQTGTELFDHAKRLICFRIHPNSKEVIFVDNTDVSQYDLTTKSKVSGFRISAPNNSEYQIKAAEINANCTKLALYNNYLNLMMFSIENWVTSVNESDNINIVASAFPNPTMQRVTISFEITLQNPIISIIDNMGKKFEINEFEFSNNQLSLDVSTLTNGSYTVNVKDGKNQCNSKFIIAR